MKKIFTLFGCVMMMYVSLAQNVGIGTKDPKNKLHVAGGIRIDSLANKKDSGVIFHNAEGDAYSVGLTGNKNDVLRGDGTFATAAAPTDAWLLGGNAGTDSLTNFLGTTDNKPLMFRVRSEFFGGFSFDNISIGHEALYQQYVDGAGKSNIAIGTNALQQNADDQNVAIGYGTIVNLRGDLNTAIGYGALGGSRTGMGDVGFATSNVAIGALTLSMLHGGTANTAVGVEALRGSVGDVGGGVGSGSIGNTGIGYRALRNYSGVPANGEGSGQGYNTAVGGYALYSDTWGDENTAIGYQALFSAEVPRSLTAVGHRALYSNTIGVGLTATGHGSLTANTTGNYNTANGNQSLFASTSGSYNSASGYKAMYTNTTGSNNTATGFKALNFNTTGNQNSAFGFEALNTNTTGHNNTAVGYQADVSSANLRNATAIGYQAKVNASNKVRIGNAAVTVIEGQVPFTTPSDGRYKYNVKEDVHGLDFILKLRPVTYQFDVKRFDNADHMTYASLKDDVYEKATLLKRTGFIAQEVEEAAHKTNYDFSGVVKPETDRAYYSLSYESFVVPLVKAVQEQQQIINDLIKRIDLLENKK